MRKEPVLKIDIGHRQEQLLDSLSNVNQEDQSQFHQNEIHLLLTEIYSKIQSGHFENAFIPIKRLRDHLRLIKTHFDDETHTLIRDARSARSHHVDTDFCEYLIIGLNYLNGLGDLLRDTDGSLSDDHSLALKELAAQFIHDIIPAVFSKKSALIDANSTAEDILNRFFHSALVPYLRHHNKSEERISIKEAEKRLFIARHFANMKMTPYAVATITAHSVVKPLIPENHSNDSSDRTVILAEIDLPLLEPTEQLKTLYRSRKNLNNELSESEHSTIRELSNWYIHQPPYIQKLIDLYAEDIMDAKAMIPAQLFSCLVGARNTYQKTTATLDTNKGSHKIINTAYHSGTQAHLLSSEEENLAATQLTLDQHQHLIGSKHLNVNTLLSPANPFSSDRKTTPQIQLAIEKRDDNMISMTNTPMNTMRKLSGRQLTFISNVVNNIDKYLPHLPYPLTQGQRHPFHLALRHLENLDTQSDNTTTVSTKDLENYLLLAKHYLALTKELNQPARRFLPGKHNHNLRIATAWNLFASELARLQGLHDNSFRVLSGCKSGQDRSGMLSLNTSAQALATWLVCQKELTTQTPAPSNAIAVQTNLIQHRLAVAGHTQEMAGNAGTGFGGEGIKAHSLGALGRQYSSSTKRALSRRSAYANEIRPKNITKPFYKKSQFWAGLGLALAGAAMIASGVLAIAGMILAGIASATLLTPIAASTIAVGTASIAYSTQKLYRTYQHRKKLGKNLFPHRTSKKHNQISPATSAQVTEASANENSTMTSGADMLPATDSADSETGNQTPYDESGRGAQDDTATAVKTAALPERQKVSNNTFSFFDAISRESTTTLVKEAPNVTENRETTDAGMMMGPR